MNKLIIGFFSICSFILAVSNLEHFAIPISHFYENPPLTLKNCNFRVGEYILLYCQHNYAIFDQLSNFLNFKLKRKTFNVITDISEIIDADIKRDYITIL